MTPWKIPVVVLAAVSVFLLVLLQWTLHVPLRSDVDERLFAVEEGESSEAISARLKEAGIIRSRYAFDYYVWREDLDDRLQAGEYGLSPSMSVIEVARALAGGKGANRDVTVTVPEGFAVRQIAERLAARGLVESADAFLETRVALAEFPFVPRLGEDAAVAQVEGYLFPETYRFDPEGGPLEYAERMLREFDERIARPFALEIAASERSLRAIVIMASLLEDEVRSAEDRAVVAGVLWKRLAIGMPLQVDATVAYATGRKEISREDLNVDSSYNTYRHRGLPPGPINNPGVSAIVAALRPQVSPYLYYLSAPSGETVFSRTLEEHNVAKARYVR